MNNTFSQTIDHITNTVQDGNNKMIEIVLPCILMLISTVGFWSTFSVEYSRDIEIPLLYLSYRLEWSDIVSFVMGIFLYVLLSLMTRGYRSNTLAHKMAPLHALFLTLHMAYGITLYLIVNDYV